MDAGVMKPCPRCPARTATPAPTLVGGKRIGQMKDDENDA
jgi:hypothetical protein